MDKPMKLLQEQMKAVKFRREEQKITVQFFSDGLIVKLFRVLICLAIGVEVIDKLNPSVKCFPIGRTFLPTNAAKNLPTNAAKNIRDYNYQNFLNVYCETAIEDYKDHLGFTAWKATCPAPAGKGAKGKKCSTDLDQTAAAAALSMKMYNGTDKCKDKSQENIIGILRAKQTSIRKLFDYIFNSFVNSRSLYECRPRILYYYFMSWSIMIYALFLGLGPSLWNFLFAQKIADRIRHLKDFVDAIQTEEPEKKKVLKERLREQVTNTWDSSKMMGVAVFRTVFTLIVTLIWVLLFIRGYRTDIDNLGFTICRVHNYEYAKCASARVGLIYFVLMLSLLTFALIIGLCLSGLWSLARPAQKEKMFLVSLLRDELEINVGRCCSDLLVMSLLCEQNRLLFGSAWKRYSQKGSMKLNLKWKWARGKTTNDSPAVENEESAL